MYIEDRVNEIETYCDECASCKEYGNRTRGTV